MGVVIILNTFAIGLSLDFKRYWRGWVAIDGVFAALFILEIVWKLYLAGWHDFFTGKDKRWHIFETLLAVHATLEVILGLVFPLTKGASGQFSLLRLMRLIRV